MLSHLQCGLQTQKNFCELERSSAQCLRCLIYLLVAHKVPANCDARCDTSILMLKPLLDSLEGLG